MQQDVMTYWRPVVEVVNGLEDVRAGALGDVAKQVAHGRLGVRADVVHVLLNRLQTIVLDDYKSQLQRPISRSVRGVDILAWMS